MAKQRIFYNALYNLWVFPLVNLCISLHKKWSFSLRISSVNVTKSAVLVKKSFVENFIFCAVCMQWILKGPTKMFLATSLTQTMPESPLIMLENIWYHDFTWNGQNLQKIVALFQFSSGPRGPKIETIFTITFSYVF